MPGGEAPRGVSDLLVVNEIRERARIGCSARQSQCRDLWGSDSRDNAIMAERADPVVRGVTSHDGGQGRESPSEWTRMRPTREAESRALRAAFVYARKVASSRWGCVRRSRATWMSRATHVGDQQAGRRRPLRPEHGNAKRGPPEHLLVVRAVADRHHACGAELLDQGRLLCGLVAWLQARDRQAEAHAQRCHRAVGIGADESGLQDPGKAAEPLGDAVEDLAIDWRPLPICVGHVHAPVT